MVGERCATYRAGVLQDGAISFDDSTVTRNLSPREREVLDAISLGLTNRQVAQRLAVSVHAVKFHLASIYRKLEVANRTEAVATLLRETPTARIGD